MDASGTLIAELRTGAGLSARAVARRAGLSTTTITRAEAGQVDVGMETLHRIAAACGYALDIRPHRIPRLSDVGDAAGDDTADWTPMRLAVDYAFRHPEHADVVCAEPLGVSERARTLMGAVAERMANMLGIVPPAWAQQCPALDEPWEHPGTAKMRLENRRMAPPEFARRNIWLRADGIFR